MVAPPETPVALIRWGTMSEQFTVIGTLADIADKAAAVGLEPPVVTVVGDVVNLAERLQWFFPRAAISLSVIPDDTRFLSRPSRVGIVLLAQLHLRCDKIHLRCATINWAIPPES